MKKIFLSIFLLFTLCSSFAQIPFNGSLLIKSGLKKNTIVYGSDTLKFGWESGSVFTISKANGQRLAKFNMNDSSTSVYNKLILESPNDTMLSVRGTVRVSENVILGDSNNYNGLNIVPIGDGIVQWAIENYNDSTLYLAATYDFDEIGSDFDVITQDDILIFHDTLDNEYIGKVVMLIPAQIGKYGVISPLRATISIEDALTLVGSIEREIYKGTLDSIIGNHSIVIGNNNIIDNEQVFIIGNSVTTSQNNTIYVNDDIKIGEITLLPTITITDWTQSSDYLYYMYSNPDIMHFSDAALNYWQVGDVLIMCGMNERVSDSIPRDVFRVDSIVSIGADSLYHYVTALYGSIEDAYENSDWGAYKGTFVEGRTHNAINIGSDNTIANKGSHIIGLSNYTTTADSTLFVNNITIKSSLKADDANVQNLLTTENIVVADSLMYNTESANIVINSSSIITATQILFARDGSHQSDYLTLVFSDIILRKGDFINIYDTVNNHSYKTIEILDAISTSPNDQKYNIAYNTFIDLGGALGYVEKLNISYDTTKKIVVDGVFEMADSVLVVNSSERTSIFNGKVIMRNPTDTLLSVRGNAKVDTLFYSAINPAIPAWFSNGNTGTDPSVNFIGTTDTGRLVFKINSVYAGTIDSTLNYANRGGATHFGYRSGQKDTIYGNSFFGYFAGSENTGGIMNVGVGAFSLSSNIIGEYNTAVGQNSMRYTTGGWNTAVGQASLQSNIDGEYNTVVGEDSYQKGFTGSYNSGLGAATLNNCSGNYNTSLGNHSGNKLTTGSYNLFVGNYAGYWGNWNYKGFIDVIDRGDSASQLTSSPIVIDFNADSSLQKTTFNSSVTVNDTAYLSTTTISGRLNVINAADTAVVVNGNLKADTIFGVTQMPYQSYVVRLTENLQWANSGPLVVGETYRIDALNTGDDFSNVGYMMPEMSFVATGTTPTNWSNGTYILNVTQSNPIVTVLYNSIGNVAWKYSGAKGSYRATFSESYDFNKIAIFPAIPTLPPLQVITQGLTTYEGVGFFLNSYLIDASLNSYQADGVFTDYMFEVRIYP